MSICVVPKPQNIQLLEGVWSVPEYGAVCAPESWNKFAMQLLEQPALHGWTLRKADGSIRFCEEQGMQEQEYRLEIFSQGITLYASSQAGVRYGVYTLLQLLREKEIPCCIMKDWPQFRVRGYMLDVSRGRMPRLPYLKQLADKLAMLKYNHLQLYVDDLLLQYSCLLGEQPRPFYSWREIRELDTYCRERGIELTANQNTLGHMQHWIGQERFSSLAIDPAGYSLRDGVHRPAATIDPRRPESRQLAEGIFESILWQFSGSKVNIGCDEPMELERVEGPQRTQELVAEYAADMQRICEKHGKDVLMWDDALLGHPEDGAVRDCAQVLRQMPEAITLLEWGYESEHPFAARLQRLADAQRKFWVCPGTSSWDSFVGRSQNSWENIGEACRRGNEYGAEGMLLTDWGDDGHPQFPVISVIPCIRAADCAWNTACPSDRETVLACADTFFLHGDTGAAQVLWDAGNTYQLEPFKLFNRSVLYHAIQDDWQNNTQMRGQTPEHFVRMEEHLLLCCQRMQQIHMDETCRQQFVINCEQAVLACRLGRLRLKDYTADPAAVLQMIEQARKDLERLWQRDNELCGKEIFDGILQQRAEDVKKLICKGEKQDGDEDN